VHGQGAPVMQSDARVAEDVCVCVGGGGWLVTTILPRARDDANNLPGGQDALAFGVARCEGGEAVSAGLPSVRQAAAVRGSGRVRVAAASGVPITRSPTQRRPGAEAGNLVAVDSPHCASGGKKESRQGRTSPWVVAGFARRPPVKRPYR
jgi:hypothetical protein